MSSHVYALLFIFFFNDTATTEIYTLSLHDALPISHDSAQSLDPCGPRRFPWRGYSRQRPAPQRSEEHTSELQSRLHLVCRLLLEKKKKDSVGRSCDEVASACHERRHDSRYETTLFS